MRLAERRQGSPTGEEDAEGPDTDDEVDDRLVHLVQAGQRADTLWRREWARFTAGMPYQDPVRFSGDQLRQFIVRFCSRHGTRWTAADWTQGCGPLLAEVGLDFLAPGMGAGHGEQLAGDGRRARSASRTPDSAAVAAARRAHSCHGRVGRRAGSRAVSRGAAPPDGRADGHGTAPATPRRAGRMVTVQSPASEVASEGGIHGTITAVSAILPPEFPHAAAGSAISTPEFAHVTAGSEAPAPEVAPSPGRRGRSRPGPRACASCPGDEPAPQTCVAVWTYLEARGGVGRLAEVGSQFGLTKLQAQSMGLRVTAGDNDGQRDVCLPVLSDAPGAGRSRAAARAPDDVQARRCQLRREAREARSSASSASESEAAGSAGRRMRRAARPWRRVGGAWRAADASDIPILDEDDDEWD